MKHKFYSFAFFLLIIFFFVIGCKKHKSDNPVDQLPPATQIRCKHIWMLGKQQSLYTQRV